MPEERFDKLTAYVLAAIFLAAIFIPFLGSVIQTDTIKSETEKRVLTPLPTMPKSIKELRRYPDKFNLYYQDNFGFRENLLWHHILKYWIGDSPSENVIIGKDGWLFYTGEPSTDLINVARGIHKFKDSDLKKYAEVLGARYRWLKNKGIRYLFIIAPNKHSIYPEYLPDNIFRVNSKTMTDQFVNYMRQNSNVPILDLRHALLSQKSPDTLLYFKTDTHWNHFGSNIAQYEIAKILASYYPDQITPVLYKKSDIKTRNGAGGDLSAMIGLKYRINEIYTSPLLDPCSNRPSPPNGDYRTTFDTTCGKSNINALIFRDSFFEYLYQYISLYFNHATFISKRLQYSDLNKYISIEKPNIVIEEWVERYLPNIPELEPELKQTN